MARSKKLPLGLTLYQGPSLINGEPIVCLLSGIRTPSSNKKTGSMLQTWILSTEQVPHEAAKSGADRAVCGDCPHRPANLGSCYVTLFHGPRQVYRSWEQGKYPDWEPIHDRLLKGQAIRFGAYGDPAAVPLYVWERLKRVARTHTGYTHQAHDPAAQGLKPFAMASADSEKHALALQADGWRTFRVKRPEDPVLDNETVCPASDEFEAARGFRTSCDRCGLCAGASKQAKSIVINAHGHAKGNFIRAELKHESALPIIETST